MLPAEQASTRILLPAVRVLGLALNPLRMAEVVELASTAIDHRRCLRIGVVNAAKIVHMQRNEALRNAVLDCDLLLADGMAVVWAARLLGHPLPERVAGIDLMLRLLDRANQRRNRVYLLGATQPILESVVALVRQRWPHVGLAGYRNGYFPPVEEAQVAQTIAEAGADLLLVAMTSPKKELFISRWARTMHVPVCHGVGGSFDVLAGKVRRAPPTWQRFGLEWAYRALQEPRRLGPRYLISNSAFCGIVAREFWVRRRTPGA